MASPSRFKKIGVAGGNGPQNTQDSFIQTVEAPIVAVASAAQQDTGVKLPNGGVQAISAFIQVDTPEVTGLDKTVSVGIFGGVETRFLNSADVVTPGVTGETLQAAVNTDNDTIGYTLGSADFAELSGTLILTIVGRNG